MGFGKKIDITKYPRRQWAIVGPSGSGKSAFAARMRGPIRIVDSDGQFEDVAFMMGIDNAYVISEKMYEMREVDKICAILEKNMPGDGSDGTIVVDSLTPIIKRIITAAMDGNSHTRVSDFTGKALAMRKIIDAVTQWGTDVLWVYHKEQTTTTKGDKVMKESVGENEILRLQKHINARLEIVMDKEKRGIKVLWSRGRFGETLWDETGMWEGMPDRLEAYMYGNLTKEEKEKFAKGVFNSPKEAWAWGNDQDVFDDIKHAENAYNKLKVDLLKQFGGDLTAEIMYEAWRNEVANRVDAKAKEDEKDGQ